MSVELVTVCNRDQMVSLNGPWRYAPDAPQYGIGDHNGWSRADHDDAKWPAMDIPQCWDLVEPALHGFEGYIWFRRAFDAQPLADGRVYLVFEGANYRTDVWINDHYLGHHLGGFTPFRFRVDECLRDDGQNTIVVRVDNQLLPERLPGLGRGWFNYGGIFRDVYLSHQPTQGIRDIEIETVPLAMPGESGPATVRLKLTVQNDGLEPFSGELRASIGNVTSTSQVTIDPHSGSVSEVSIDLPNVQYWSPTQPALQDLHIELVHGDTAVDQHNLRVGIREFRVEGPLLLLNGSEIRLKGFNRHEDYPTTGRANEDDLLSADLEAIKATGANFIRASHYPQHRHFYDACDEMGFLVMDEIPLWQWGHDANFANNRSPIDDAFGQLAEMVAQNRTRTCVVIWSVSNETKGGQPAVDDANIRMMRFVRELDATRPVTHVTHNEVWTDNRDRAFEEADLICINEYEGILGPLNPAALDADGNSVAVAKLGADLDRLHQDLPGKPVVVTEFGGMGIAGHHYDSPWSEEGYAAAIRAHWETFAARDWIKGALVWCWQDYPGHRNWLRARPSGQFGIVTADRTPKQACLDVVTKAFTDTL